MNELSDETRCVLKKTMVRLHLSGQVHAAEKYPEAHLAAFRSLDQAEPGGWSLGVGLKTIFVLRGINNKRHDAGHAGIAEHRNQTQ